MNISVMKILWITGQLEGWWLRKLLISFCRKLLPVDLDDVSSVCLLIEVCRQFVCMQAIYTGPSLLNMDDLQYNVQGFMVKDYLEILHYGALLRDGPSQMVLSYLSLWL